jgi:hypothetical protein
VSAEILLRELIEEVRGLRADLRRQTNAAAAAPALIAAIDEYFGDCRFTVSGLLDLSEEYDELADALAGVIDPNAGARSRATRLGSILSRSPEIEIVAEQRGCAVYRLRT